MMIYIYIYMYIDGWMDGWMDRQIDRFDFIRLDQVDRQMSVQMKCLRTYMT